VWILLGRNDAAFLRYWNRQLDKFGGVGMHYYGAYGRRLRIHFSIDQLGTAYEALKANPDTRQIVLQIWDVRSDFPFENGEPRSEDIPCNLISLVKLRNGRLEWMQVLRSNDFFLGIPHNFVQFTYLQEILAGWLNVEVGTYNQVSDSLHIYTGDMEKIDQSLPISVSPNTDTLALPKEVSDQCFSELGRRIDLLVSESLSEAGHRRTSIWSGAPQGFQNLLTLIASEAARKRGWVCMAAEIMLSNTNPVLIQLWDRWLERIKSRS
jgi:thymidylate synthase